MKPQKKPLILLELLIALSLTAILLTLLFSFFVESAKIEKKLDTARTASMHRGSLQTRLQMILTSIDRSSTDPYFYTKFFEKEKNLSLIAIFDNGIDPDPTFSGSIVGRIYLDQKKNLCLATWPLSKDKNRPWRKEILFPHVKDFEFEFLWKEEVSWKLNWPKTMREVPAIIRLTLYEEGSKEPIRYAFILPVSAPFVTYSEKKGAAI